MSSVNAILFLLFSVLNLISAAELKGHLVLTQLLFRHGDRTPVDPYPTDPWNNLIFWPTGWGQLTNIGKVQHYKLGQWFKMRYATLINSTYSKDEIYIQSTDVDRTLMSALSNLAGLYPPEKNDIWNNNISWQPIPVHTIPEKQDYILATKKPCPAYERALNELEKSDEFRKLNIRYKYLYDYLTKYTGRTIKSLENVENIYNTLYIEALYNKTLPTWTKQVFPGGDMKIVADLSFKTRTYTRQLAKLKSGPLLKEILHRFNKKINAKLNPNRSIWMYSGHDFTIADILNTLNLFEGNESPPYTACVIFELRIHNKIPLISIFYKNSSLEPLPLYIPNCGTQCTLQDMFTLYNNVIPVDWESECKLSLLSTIFDDISFLMVSAVISSSFLLFTLIYFYYKQFYYKKFSYVRLN